MTDITPERTASPLSGGVHPDPPPGDAGAPAALVLLAASIAGAAVMGIELAAVRLLAPWFGTSLPVWTNVIGVLLLGLALGQALGARLSRCAYPAGRLAWLLMLGGVAAALLPPFAGTAANAFLPPELTLDAATGLLTWGSLATATALFLAPAVVLGTSAPLAVECLARTQGPHSGSGSAGRAGGRILAVSTMGSLVGTFATTHYLLPEFGVRASFLLFAGLLASVGLLLWLATRALRSAASTVAVSIVSFGAIAAAASSSGSERALTTGYTTLAQAESPYQRVRVLEQQVDSTTVMATTVMGAAQEGPMRLLQVNESSDSFQSVGWSAPGWLPEGYYYNDFALPFYWIAGEGMPSEPLEVAVLGLGGGTAWRLLEGAVPEGLPWRSIGFELDPTIVELAQEHMDLPRGEPRLQVAAGIDARVGLGRVGRDFDVIVLDCYANQVEVPPHLSSLKFFREIHDRLKPGGWLVANVGAFGLEDPVLGALGLTAATAFDARALALRVPISRNATLFLRKDAALPDPSDPAWIPDESLVPLLAPREAPGAWRFFDSDSEGTLLTEDRNPILQLQQQSISEAQRS